MSETVNKKIKTRIEINIEAIIIIFLAFENVEREEESPHEHQKKIINSNFASID